MIIICRVVNLSTSQLIHKKTCLSFLFELKRAKLSVAISLLEIANNTYPVNGDGGYALPHNSSRIQFVIENYASDNSSRRQFVTKIYFFKFETIRHQLQILKNYR